MSNKELTVLNTEKEEAEKSLKHQIKTLRSILNNVERRLNAGEVFYGNEGLQGNSIKFDATISKIVSYTSAIEQFENYVARQENKE